MPEPTIDRQPGPLASPALAQETQPTASKPVLLRTFADRLQASRQAPKLPAGLAVRRELYHAALEEREEAWKRARKSVGYAGQTRGFTGIRLLPEDVADGTFRPQYTFHD